ncbi:hypothetical protein F4779DRAFT_607000 [Xylariaceae sp. FL0662B]|nr:hypothetical protein F4779DRAFT_607000 [Xylariaceae sp. FL0662B]
MRLLPVLFGAVALILDFYANAVTTFAGQKSLGRSVHGRVSPDKASFLDALVSNMTVEDLVLQLHLMFGGDIVGVESETLKLTVLYLKLTVFHPP